MKNRELPPLKNRDKAIARCKELPPCAVCGESWNPVDLDGDGKLYPSHDCTKLGARVTVGWSHGQTKPAPKDVPVRLDGGLLLQEAQEDMEAFPPRPSKLKVCYGWMCGVDFDFELGEAAGGNKIYPSKEDLMERRKCVSEESKEHRPVKVVTVSKEDFESLIALAGIKEEDLITSAVGEVIWTRQDGWVKDVGGK
jgi:hypothetical protein